MKNGSGRFRSMGSDQYALASLALAASKDRWRSGLCLLVETWAQPGPGPGAAALSLVTAASGLARRPACGVPAA